MRVIRVIQCSDRTFLCYLITLHAGVVTQLTKNYNSHMLDGFGGMIILGFSKLYLPKEIYPATPPL